MLAAGQAAAGAVRQTEAGAAAGVGEASGEAQQVLKEGLAAAKDAVETVVGEAGCFTTTVLLRRVSARAEV